VGVGRFREREVGGSKRKATHTKERGAMMRGAWLPDLSHFSSLFHHYHPILSSVAIASELVQPDSDIKY
jgi:hypothetical protein